MTTAGADLDPDDVPTVDREILAALARLLQDKPLEDISVALIVAEASTSRATFYCNFSDKDDAFTALSREVAETMTAPFLEAVEHRRSPRLSEVIERWITVSGPQRIMLQRVMEEWPRTPDLREAYVEVVQRLTAALAHAIDTDRAARTAPPGAPSEQLAAALVWMAERAVYRALTAAPHMQDPALVAAALASVFQATIYGSGQRKSLSSRP